MSIATMYVDLREREGSAWTARRSAATPAPARARRASASRCRASKYCPSHKHLDEELDSRSRRRPVVADSGDSGRAPNARLRAAELQPRGSFRRDAARSRRRRDIHRCRADRGDGRLVTAKAPSTPDDQSRGVIDAVEAALEQADASAADVERFVHGMTVGTNALLEGKVAKTALFATEGFTDLEELGRQARAELYRLCAGHPPPLVPADLRVPVPERCGPDGVLRELDEDELRDPARRPARRRRVGGGLPALGLPPPRPRARAPRRWSPRRRTSTCRPRTTPRACSASTSAAPRRSSTRPCRRCCAATWSG